MSYPFLSAHRPGAPIHSVAWHHGQYNTIPSCVDCDRSASWIIDAVADESGPRLVEEKGQAIYFLTTPLRIAPYVGKTAEKFPRGAQGQMRSASHVIAGTWFPFDLDGLTEAIWTAILDRLQASGAKFCVYTTWSFGLASKPGIRVRTLLFLDRGLAPQDWTRAWQVINAHYFEGLADPKTQYLHQQAGVWATAADRAPQSFRHVGGQYLLSADDLLATAPPVKPKLQVPSRGWSGLAIPGVADNPRVVTQATRALDWLDANDYATWTGRGLPGLKGLVATRDLSPQTARSLWLTWTTTAGEEAQTHNADRRYHPEVMWDGWTPSTAPPEALTGALFAAARDQARELLVTESRQGRLSARVLLAARYLADYHRRLFQELLHAAQQGS
jgi:hypothetical protein